MQVDAPRGYDLLKVFTPTGRLSDNYPLHWAVQTSADRTTWSAIIGSGGPETSSNQVTDIRFPMQSGPSAKYVRIYLTQSVDFAWWSIGEVQVFGPGGTSALKVNERTAEPKAFVVIQRNRERMLVKQCQLKSAPIGSNVYDLKETRVLSK